MDSQLSKPFISIIIPTFNSSEYLEETLKSLANQTSHEFEVLVIDDQSSDNTLEVAVDAFKKNNLRGKIIRRPDEISKGVSNCRNLGIKIAKSEWISFLDSDDLFLPEKIEGTINFIKQFGNNCFAYFHAARQFEDKTNRTIQISVAPSFKTPENILPRILKQNIITTATVTVKKTLLEKIGGFDTTLHGIEDYMLWLRVAKQTNWYYSNDVWTDYRVRKESLMGGREMKYYITQNNNLLIAARKLHEFSSLEISEIESYLFDDVMHYYASVALNVRGWGDFTKGLSALIKIGKIKLAFILFSKHTKFLMKNIIVQLFIKKVKK